MRAEAGRPGRCSARVPQLTVAARSLPPSLPALRALRPSAAPGKPAVLTARRAGRAGEVWERRPSMSEGAWTPFRVGPVQCGPRNAVEAPRASGQQRSSGLSRESSQAHCPAMAGPPGEGSLWVLPSLLTLTAVLHGPKLLPKRQDVRVWTRSLVSEAFERVHPVLPLPWKIPT